MKKLVVAGEVVLGRLKLANENYFRHHIRKLEGKVKVVVERLYYKRSLKQNALYWAWLHVLANETGNVADELHEYFKTRYLPHKDLRLGNKKVPIPRSTTELTKGQMAELMLHVEQEAAQLNVKLPTSLDDWEQYYDSSF